MEAEHYQDICLYVLDEIFQYSPQTVTMLRRMFEQTNAKLTYYAAFIIICLEAQVQKEGYRSIERVEMDDLRSYTFFKLAEKRDEAQEMFREMLQQYQSDCQRRFACSS
jgi:hypothetical protein